LVEVGDMHAWVSYAIARSAAAMKVLLGWGEAEGGKSPGVIYLQDYLQDYLQEMLGQLRMSANLCMTDL